MNQCDGCRAQATDPRHWRTRNEGHVRYHDKLVTLGPLFVPEYKWQVQMVCQANRYVHNATGYTSRPA